MCKDPGPSNLCSIPTYWCLVRVTSGHRNGDMYGDQHCIVDYRGDESTAYKALVIKEESKVIYRCNSMDYSQPVLLKKHL